MYYFAYGSCMSFKDLERTVGNAQFVGAAILNDYELAFTKYSRGRSGGVADIVSKPGCKVEGIVFEVEDFKALDRREGVHIRLYKRIPVELVLSQTGETINADTYTVVEKEAQEVVPSEDYMNIILDGATRLSEQYQNDLKDRFNKFRETL
ncbi:gamma-glutamylcyclotransferase family protein [Schinkia sp. CFF1]